MNHPAQRSNLPWLAAVTAILVVLAWQCLNFGLLMLRAPSDNEQILSFVGMTVRTVGEGLLVHGGLAFFVAQWRGERSGEWTFRRPLLLAGVFAGGLVAWNLLVMFLYQGVFLLTGPEQMQSWLRIWVLVLGLVVAPLQVWSSWRLALLVCRKDAIATPPQSDLRLRAAGLAGWMQAAGTVLGVSMLLPLANAFDAYSPVAWLSSWAGALLAGALAFGGAWLALPRDMSRVRAGRLLGAGVLTFVFAYALAVGVGVAALVLALGGQSMDQTAAVVLMVMLGVLPLLGMFGFQWLWTRVLYAKLRRATAA